MRSISSTLISSLSNSLWISKSDRGKYTFCVRSRLLFENKHLRAYKSVPVFLFVFLTNNLIRLVIQFSG